jgi:hypothetical protein
MGNVTIKNRRKIDSIAGKFTTPYPKNISNATLK